MESGLVPLLYYNALEIEGFSRMMKDPSDCYKFYWLEVIVLMFLIKRYPDLQIRPEKYQSGQQCRQNNRILQQVECQ